jgi:hypothetical protein
MATIGWDETAPADGDVAGLGDDEIRSLKTSLRQGLESEHEWPSTGGSAGTHLAGSARAYYGTESAVSSADVGGRLMATSDTSRLFGVGSTGTVLFGGATALLTSVRTETFPGWSPPQVHYFARVTVASQLSL